MKINKLVVAAFGLLVGAMAVETCYAQKKPNIIIIISDDHAYQAIGAYGNKLAQTPGIDRIASEGALFNKAYVTNSLCGPSRATIITGKYSHINGFKNNDNEVFDATQDIFPKRLQAAGYQTAWIGKWHLNTTPQGFNYFKILPGQGDYYNPDFINVDGSRQRIEGYVTNIIEDESEKWLNNRDKNKPFCLIIGHKATHRTWIPDTVDMGRYDQVNFPLPSNFYDDYNNRKAAQVQNMTVAKTMRMAQDLKMLPFDEKNIDPGIIRMNAKQRAKFDAYYNPIYADLKSKNLVGKALIEWKFQHYMHDYLNTAAALDRNIQRTLKYLDNHHLTKNTVVIYMSDQGFYMGEHGWFDKRWIYEESFRTPMMMRYPGVIKPGTRLNNFVLNLDIAPTLLQIARVPIPKDIQGQSFLPLVEGKKEKWRDEIYYHYYEIQDHNVSPHFGIKTRRYKLIRFYQLINSWELYDLEADPHEMNNVYGKKGYQKITDTLKSHLKKLIDKYKDKEAAVLFSTNS